MKTAGMVNHFYVYAVDAEFGPFFLKFCSYFPYNAKLCLNGHEWAKRQATKAGIAFTALDNGFATVGDPATLQTICDQLDPEQIDALLRKWLAILPHPFSAGDREAGYRYDVSILQAEFSLTQVLDKPVSGGCFSNTSSATTSTPAPGPDRAGLRPPTQDQRTAAHPGPVPHPGHHRRRHPEPVCRLQAHRDQAVPQGRQGAAHRDDDQRHPRLRYRETADQPARAAGGRLLRQPTPARRPTTQPQPDPRRGRLHRCARSNHYRRRAPYRRTAPRGSPRPRAAASAADVPVTPQRIPQPRPAWTARRPARQKTPTTSAPARSATTCAGCVPTA